MGRGARLAAPHAARHLRGLPDRTRRPQRAGADAGPALQPHGAGSRPRAQAGLCGNVCQVQARRRRDEGLVSAQPRPGRHAARRGAMGLAGRAPGRAGRCAHPLLQRAAGRRGHRLGGLEQLPAGAPAPGRPDPREARRRRGRRQRRYALRRPVALGHAGLLSAVGPDLQRPDRSLGHPHAQRPPRLRGVCRCQLRSRGHRLCGPVAKPDTQHPRREGRNPPSAATEPGPTPLPQSLSPA
mmetsp:Transcript_66502/g.156974  ORF Transcript_66502/g.156974 Transcript_66502/m.156974 type:complete len:240 (+) Transcript_66502:1529-2248(+)